MRKFEFLILTIVLSFFINVSCTAQIGALKIDDFSLKIDANHTISLQDRTDSLVENLGNPISIERKEEYNYQNWLYNNYIVGFYDTDSSLNNIRILADGPCTKRGLKVGDDSKKVLELYGSPDLEVEGALSYIFLLPNEKNKVPQEMILLFSIDEESIVSGITMYIDW